MEEIATMRIRNCKIHSDKLQRFRVFIKFEWDILSQFLDKFVFPIRINIVVTDQD